MSGSLVVPVVAWRCTAASCRKRPARLSLDRRARSWVTAAFPAVRWSSSSDRVSSGPRGCGDGWHEQKRMGRARLLVAPPAGPGFTHFNGAPASRCALPPCGLLVQRATNSSLPAQRTWRNPSSRRPEKQGRLRGRDVCPKGHVPALAGLRPCQRDRGGEPPRRPSSISARMLSSPSVTPLRAARTASMIVRGSSRCVWVGSSLTTGGAPPVSMGSDLRARIRRRLWAWGPSCASSSRPRRWP